MIWPAMRAHQGHCTSRSTSLFRRRWSRSSSPLASRRSAGGRVTRVDKVPAARPRSLGETLLRSYRLAHERLLKAAEEMSPEQFAWSAGPSLHSAAWQLWHAARWDDVFASYFHRALAQEPRTQVWERDSLAVRWSLAPARWAGATQELSYRTRPRK